MSIKTLSGIVAVVLITSLAVPAAFLLAPQKAHAQQYGSCLGGLVGGAVGGVLGAATAVPVNSTVGNGISTSIFGSTLGSCINEFVIEPLIKAAIRALLQKLTATVIKWINGGNGTGQPSYVQNLPGSLQNVGDNQAISFFAQFGANSNSPFAAAITSSLSTNYLQNTSSGGFFAANKDTLVTTAGSAANEQAFLNGNWSQGGGVNAWFALTTQSQNNPYMLYQSSQSQLGSLISGAQTSRLNTLSWGQGFLSWCGPASTPPTQPVNGNVLAPVAVTAQKIGTANGDACQNADGTWGNIQTPGMVISEYTKQAVVDSGFQQYINANDLDSAFDAIISALVNQVLGGVGGLFGASQGATTGGRTLVDQLQTYANATAVAPGTTASTIVNGQALQDATTRATQYQSSWSVLRATANFASTALTNLANSCPAQAAAAQAALASEVTPILTQADAADAATAAVLAMIQQVQNELNSGSPNYAADLQTLSGMQPQDADVTSAQQATQTTGAAIANPPGSLTITGGTTIDQIALISANAAALQAACGP